jgi:hypothetical protein
MQPLNPDDFVLGEDVTDVARRPGGAGMVVSVRFDSVEAFNVLARAEFNEETLTEYIRRLVLTDAYAPAYRVFVR